MYLQINKNLCYALKMCMGLRDEQINVLFFVLGVTYFVARELFSCRIYCQDYF